MKREINTAADARTENRPEALKISVILCTRNPRWDYLERVLFALQNQTLSTDRWELLIMDNGSSPALKEKLDLSWHQNGYVISESRPGKTFALIRAIKVFRGELFLVVDDDNVLTDNYLDEALNISSSYPWIGAWAASYQPEFESEPSPHLRPWLGGLVVDKISRPVWTNLVKGAEASPPGAGMVVRRCAAEKWADLAQCDPLRMRLGPAGTLPGAGDDADMALCSLYFGMGTGRFPSMRLTHLIPSRKLTLTYLKALYFSQAHAAAIVPWLFENSPLPPKKPRWIRTKVALLGFLLAFQGKAKVERVIRRAKMAGRLTGTLDLVKAINSESLSKTTQTRTKLP